jgi:hypothetical protein
VSQVRILPGALSRFSSSAGVSRRAPLSIGQTAGRCLVGESMTRRGAHWSPTASLAAASRQTTARTTRYRQPRRVADEFRRVGVAQTLGIESVELSAVLDTLATVLDEARVFDGLTTARDALRVAGAVAWVVVLDGRGALARTWPMRSACEACGPCSADAARHPRTPSDENPAVSTHRLLEHPTRRSSRPKAPPPFRLHCGSTDLPC